MVEGRAGLVLILAKSARDYTAILAAFPAELASFYVD